jgi:ENTS family enterobactin (siderophore) exporter
VAGALALVTLAESPSVLVVLALGGLLAGASSLASVMRAAIVPNLVPPGRLRSALALDFGLFQLTGIVGPAAGGFMIAVGGVGFSYAVTAGTAIVVLIALPMLPAQRPRGLRDSPPVLTALREAWRSRAATGPSPPASASTCSAWRRRGPGRCFPCWP